MTGFLPLSDWQKVLTVEFSDKSQQSMIWAGLGTWIRAVLYQRGPTGTIKNGSLRNFRKSRQLWATSTRQTAPLPSSTWK